MTDFEMIYDCFLSKITDDMYMEITPQKTSCLLEELMFNALPWFEFPRVNIHDYDVEAKYFRSVLSDDEINIIATYMVVEWLGQQLASIELVRMKYSGSDFKFTSQANHLAKLTALKKEYERNGFHLQRVYKRRAVDKKGRVRSTFSTIMSTSVQRGNIAAAPELVGSPGYNRSGAFEDAWMDMPPLAIDEGFASEENITKEHQWNEMRSLRKDPCCPSKVDWDNM